VSVLDFLWPRRSTAAELNPAHLFGNYTNAVNGMAAAAPSPDDVKLLAQSWKIFDNETGRRTSIDTRAGALMPAISLAATLVTGVGFTVLKDAALPIDARSVILVTYVLALVYLLRTMLLLFVIHGQIFRYTVDPSDLPTPAADVAGQTSPYDRGLACRIMRYTIDNYQINNIQTNLLVIAQRSFRNAIIAIAFGGTIAGIMIFYHSIAQPIVKSQAAELPANCQPVIIRHARESGNPGAGA